MTHPSSSQLSSRIRQTAEELIGDASQARWRIILCLIAILTQLVAPFNKDMLWALDPAKKITQYVCNSWNLENGLPQMTIYAITQTRDGYLWMGTQEGLVRFDGVSFTVFDKKNVPELRSSFITALCADQRGRLWIGSFGGGIVCLENHRFHLYTAREGLSHLFIWNLYSDRKGVLWAGTGDGIFREQNGKFYMATELYTGDNRIKQIFQDSRGALWVGTENGLNMFFHRNRKFFNTNNGLTDNRIRTICETRDGRLWVGTEKGLNCYADGGWSQPFPEQNLKESLIRAIIEDRHGNLWVSAGGSGLFRVTQTETSSLSQKDGLPGNEIFSLYEDGGGGLWLGGYGSGLTRLKDSIIKTYTVKEGLSGDFVNCVTEDRNGALWIGSGDGGLSRFFNGRFNHYSVREDLPDKVIWSLLEDRSGRIWVGTEEGGLSLLQNGRFVNFGVADGLTSQKISALYSDRKGNLWIGSYGGGLNRRRDGAFSYYSTLNGLSNNMVMAIHEDMTGVLWVGTDHGLNRFQNNKFTVYTTSDGLSSDMIQSFLEEPDGSLWICTNGGGINRYRKGEFRSVGAKEGLYDDNVFRILEDDRGYFWMSSNKGVFRALKQDLHQVCDGVTDRVHCEVYTEKDGMKSRECNHWGQSSGLKSRDGKLWFPTTKGLIVIDPTLERSNTPPPPVLVEEIHIGGKCLLPPFPENPLESPPGLDRLEIHYTSLDLISPEKLQFRYRLKGFDREWIVAGNNRFAIYTGLPAGHYFFYASTGRTEGDWSESKALFSLQVRPFFHETVWFYLLILVIVGISSLGLVRLYTHRMNKRAQVLVEMMEMADKANRAKSEFLANMSHEIRTPINAILGFTDLLLSEIVEPKLRKHLISIAASGRSLLELMNDILDLSRIEAGKLELQPEPMHLASLLREIQEIFAPTVKEKELDFRIEVDPRLPAVLILDNVRLRQILFNLVGNAVKFTQSGHVQLGVRRLETLGTSSAITSIKTPQITPGRNCPDEDRVDMIISVRDSGVGIPADRLESIFEPFIAPNGPGNRSGGAGLGLAITRRLTRMMSGEITIESRLNHGSTVKVLLRDVPTAPNVGDIGSYTSHGARPVDLYAIKMAPSIILVADEKELNRQLIRNFLSGQDIAVLEAADGQEAVALAREHKPGLIFMDYRMPRMNGSEAARIIKSDIALSSIPIVFITGYDTPEQHKVMKAAGCEAILVKPIGKSDIMGQLVRFLPFTNPNSSENTLQMENHSALDVLEKVRVVGAPDIATDILHIPGDIPPVSPTADTLTEPIETYSSRNGKIRELADRLQNDYVSRWENIRKTYVLDEIEEFTTQVAELGREHESEEAIRWASTLDAALQNFDIQKVTICFETFPRLLEELNGNR